MATGTRHAAASAKRAAVARFVLSWDGRVMEGAVLPDVLPDEVWVTWKPRIVGGRSAPAMTGLAGEFLPKGIVLDLVKLERGNEECTARYRVRKGAP